MNNLNLGDCAIKLISHYLPTLKDKYNWTITYKSTFSSLYYDPIENYELLILDNNFPRGSFIQNIQIIKFQSINNVSPNFRALQSAVHFFRKLTVIDISWIVHSAKQATVALKIVPENLTLLVRRENRETFKQNSICAQKQIVVKLMRKRSREEAEGNQDAEEYGDKDKDDEEKIKEDKIEIKESENNEDEKQGSLEPTRKRRRTPSPVREIIAMELSRIEDLKKRLCEAYSEHVQVPEILHENFRINEEYDLTTKICSDPPQIQDTIDEISAKLIHGIITSKEGNWILVTQLEIYVKDRQIDDVAIVSRFDERPKKLSVEFAKLVEGRGTWCELRVLHHQFEVLVTGAIHKKGDSYSAFLGVSAPAPMANDTGLLLFSPAIPAAHVRCPRMLRNYRKKSSLNNWCVKSQRFYREGFTTIVPLQELHARGTPSYAAICARLIHTVSQNGSASDDTSSLLADLNAMQYWAELEVPQHSTKDVVLARLRAIGQLPIKQQRLSQGKRWLIEAILDPSSITDTMLVNLYNRMIYPLVKKDNKKKVKEIQARY